MKYLQRSRGHSSVAASAYRARDDFKDMRTNERHDYRHKAADLVYSELIFPSHMTLSRIPKLADGKTNPHYGKVLAAKYSKEFERGGVSRSEISIPIRFNPQIMKREAFWNFIENRLSDPRAQPAFEVEVALPRELTHEQRIDLVRRFVFDHFASEGLLVDLNIHEPTAADGEPHPHAHILMTTRRFTPNGDLWKVASDLQDAPLLIKKIYALEQAAEKHHQAGESDKATRLLDQAKHLSLGTNMMKLRASWARYTNDALSDAGSHERVDHRTLKEQGESREATPNIGYAVQGTERAFKSYVADRVKHFDAVGFRNRMRNEMTTSTRKRENALEAFLDHARVYAPHLCEDIELAEPEIDYDR